MRAEIFLATFALSLPVVGTAQAEPVIADQQVPAKWHYLDGAEAEQMVSAAQEEAAALGRNVAIIFGTERCPDTRALLQWLGQPDVAQALEPSFDFILVESGPAKDRNLALARKFGVERIEGTPTLLILSGRDGALLNRKTMSKLRTASRQTSAQRMDYFRKYRPVR